MRKHYPAGADRVVWIVTGSLIGLCVVLLAVAGGVTSLPTTVVVILYSTAGVTALLIALGWLARSVRYEIRDDSVTIVRTWPFRDVVIRRPDIKEIRHMRGKGFKPSASSLPWVFGYSGRFTSEELGTIAFYGSNPNEIVVIVAREKYVVSPANPKRFIHDLSGRK